ncbi:MAG: beta-ketoacyl-ACP synthase 3, partial [Eggerthellaceae bacterium]|nr:beta-ketoacyl-ACP synthase 3 [Eggerthellaceae bacterium]
MRILGTGSATPEHVLTNDMLAAMVDTSDEWIRTRTGVAERRTAEHETILSLALDSAASALDAAAQTAGFKREDIGLCLCATATNETRCPSLASLLQRELGLREGILAFDVNAACSGFLYSLIIASRFVEEGTCALVVGAELLSHFIDFTDRATCVLFGDGAGAAVIAPSIPSQAGAPSKAGIAGGLATREDEGPAAFFEWVTKSQGNFDVLNITDCIHMDGAAVFKFAVESLVEMTEEVLQKAHLGIGQVGLFICHQANERIIKAAAKRLGVPL